MRRPRVLIVDDEHNFRELLAEAMQAHDFDVHTAGSARSGLALAVRSQPDFVLLDQNLPDGSGLDILTELRALPSCPVVVIMTAYAATQSAVQAMKHGAYTYVTKPFDFGDLLEVLSQARISVGGGAEDEVPALAELVGECTAIVEMKQQLRRIARSPVASVLIQGESGTGKELMARAIHDLSGRGGPMVSVNCGALTDTLLMSELFGHERGAFTDARERRKGMFEAAEGGTLFLDEIGEMGAHAQAALLRVLEQRCITRVGGTVEIPVDVRIVAATNRSLRQRVAEGNFRQDLLFRLNVVQLSAPPLRERGSDIVRLARRFSAAIAARYEEPARPIAPETEALFYGYSWPGNVRELRNAIERAYIVGTGREIRPADLPLAIQPGHGGSVLGDAAASLADDDSLPDFADAKQEAVDRFEKSYLHTLLARHQGNVTKAAEEAGILRQALQRLIKRHEVDRTDFGNTGDEQSQRAAS